MIAIGLTVPRTSALPLPSPPPLRGLRVRPSGTKEQEANNFLEKRYKTEANPALSYDDTVQLALACMQNVLGSDLKATDIEVRFPSMDSISVALALSGSRSVRGNRLPAWSFRSGAHVRALTKVRPRCPLLTRSMRRRVSCEMRR